MMDDEDCSLNAINAGSATADYMAYQFKYDTIHGKYGGSVETDGDYLVINGKKIPTSRCRDPKEANWGKLGADYVCERYGQSMCARKGCEKNCETASKCQCCRSKCQCLAERQRCQPTLAYVVPWTLNVRGKMKNATNTFHSLLSSLSLSLLHEHSSTVRGSS